MKRCKILIRGAGDLATGIAYELWLAGHEILMTETSVPLAVRRNVSFSRAVYEQRAKVEQAEAVLVHGAEDMGKVWDSHRIPVLVDPEAKIRTTYAPDVLIDAIMAKRNMGTKITDAPFVIGIGPGFRAGDDCHAVIETQRGETLGQVIYSGCAIPNTGIPAEVGGYGRERLLRAAGDGVMEPLVQIGEIVRTGQLVARTGESPVYVAMDGMIRGMLQAGVVVTEGMKIGDVDARCDSFLCDTISDKARRIGRGVLEALEEAYEINKN